MKRLVHVLSLPALLLTSSTLFGQVNNESLGTSALPAVTTGDYNVSLGDYSGTLLTSGLNNTFIGTRAAGAYTEQEWNAWINSGTPLPSIGGTTYSASDNTFIGFEAGLRVLTGGDNVFIGKFAGRLNNAHDNVFIGTEAGENNTTGTDNTFVGEEAGQANTEGRDNVFIGEDAGFSNIDGDDNTAVGSVALRSNTTGWGLTAIGTEALYDNSTGIKNTGLGLWAGTDIGAGQFNTMVGAGAGGNTEHADYNTFVGVYAGSDNNRTNGTEDANRNTAIGILAGSTNRTGQDNVMIGAFADSADYFGRDEADLVADLSATSPVGHPTSGLGGDNSVSRIVNIGSYGFAKGDDAIGIGYKNRSNGRWGIAIGSGAQISGHSNAIAIGYQAVSHGINIAVIGNGTTTSIDPGADGVTALGSDTYRYTAANAKTYNALADAGSAATMAFVADMGTQNDDRWRLQAADSDAFTIASFATGAYVDVISAANNGDVTVAGDVNVNSDGRLKEKVNTIGDALKILEDVKGRTYEWKAETGRGEGTHYGLIAQEVEVVIPELVSTRESDGIKSVNYQGFVPILINAVDELKEQNRQQQKASLRQEEEIRLLREQIALQQQLLEKLSATNNAQ